MEIKNPALMDGNEAAGYIAFKTNEVAAIYPITPSSPMGEHCDLWSSRGEKNIWGTVPSVTELQSEGGAAGSVHGALQAGALTTTFTASQGLLLKIPNMFKIAGELTSTVFHISARTLATHALSIFGDHSDVMAARSTGFAMLFSNSVQEVMDLALIAQASTLEARIPFVHSFDGFRTSHEIQKIDKIAEDQIREMIDDDLVQAHRQRALSPDNPILRGTAENPDTFFQTREACNPYYEKTPEIVQKVMDKFAKVVGRQYKLFDYVGAPDAERVIILMGSGCEPVESTVNYLVSKGEKVGVIKVRLFRPFSAEHFLSVLPKTVKNIAVLDRTKEPGSVGEPLYLDVVSTILEGKSKLTSMPQVVGGRYGLSSKEFTPAMVKGVFDELCKAEPKNHFTVGINDDLSNTSIAYDPNFDIEPDSVVRAVFWGLGSDGTVGGNKNSIKIIGESTPNYAQGYFVYDSKKAGAKTISHLRFGPEPIASPYLITQANFVAVHQYVFLDVYDTLAMAKEGATFLLNTPYGPDEVWDKLPAKVQEQIINLKLKFYVIDAFSLAKEIKLGTRINTIMQTCFFALSGVMPQDKAIEKIKEAIKKTYGKRGDTVVNMNCQAVDSALAKMSEVKVPDKVTSTSKPKQMVPDDAPEFVKNVLGQMMAGEGESLPVSAMPADGTYPTGTTQYEKRNIALDLPVWNSEICIQCGKCVMVCPHSAIRSKLVDEGLLKDAPSTLKSAKSRFRELSEKKFILQVAPEDCTGCGLCVNACPTKDKKEEGKFAINMSPQLPLLEQEKVNWDFFLNLPDINRYGENGGDKLKFKNVKEVQLLRPLFEFSGACAGCGETPYVHLLSQLFGDRAYIANATGCSSIYGGNLPTTPYTYDKDGRGPTWNNSLFEDNAEFGLGMRLAIDKKNEYAKELVARMSDVIGAGLANEILNADQSEEVGVAAQRKRVVELKEKLSGQNTSEAKDLLNLADSLVKKSVWILGGDGWAYDIGYGGLDHVLATGKNVNVLVMDTEIYSNTGGQASKSTPMGSTAKFAMGGKPTPKKDLGLIAQGYQYIYVAQVSMGASDNQVVKAFQEAEAYDGPSLIIAYSHCVGHGIDMVKGLEEQKKAVDSGYWILYRFNPELKKQGKNPLQLDSKAPKIPLKDFLNGENRYRMLTKSNPEAAAAFQEEAQKFVNDRYARYEETAKSSRFS